MKGEQTMTDNEIIKALECCVSSTGSEACEGCPFNENDICDKDSNATEKYALDLILRQKAEIERLQKHNTEYARKHYNDGRAEAITEFAENLKEEIFKASKSNYDARKERLEKYCHSDDNGEFISYCNGKIDALRGIDDFIDELTNEYTKGGHKNGA